MKMPVMKKSEYAAHRGVTLAAVTNWIARKRLTAPALRDDGKIDVALADQQINAKVEPMKAASAKRRVTAKPKRAPWPKREGRDPAPAKPPTRDPALVAQETAQTRLLEARALSASVDAERKRRELEAERGRYMITEDALAAWAKVINAFLTQIEQSLPDLATSLGLDPAGRIVLRKWWRNQRVQFAAHCREVRDASPEFGEDTAA
jgi:hypothetical protein